MAHRTWGLGTIPYLERSDAGGSPPLRVVIDNDFAGDPDDLYQMAHHALSPSVEIRGIIGSHLRPGDPFDPGPGSAAHGVKRLHELLDAMGVDAGDVVWQGAEDAIVDRTTPQVSPAAEALVAEAMRDDPRPLFVCCGGGLTEIASAWLMEPRIAQRLTVIWIGGAEYPELGMVSPGSEEVEYNLAIDVRAGQVLFNDSDLTLWQVPRNVYRQCLVSDAELRRRVASKGATGALLYASLQDVARRMRTPGMGSLETYALGDSPLVLLTALQSFFQPDPSSSDATWLPRPSLDERGIPSASPDGHPVRVWTRVDTRLMFEDLFSKLEDLARWQDD